MLVTFDAKVKKKDKPKINATSTQKSEFQRGNINIIEDSVELQALLKSNRSKNGCLTCKTRKKKCNEQKPTCSNCSRLNRECIWVDHLTMTQEQIQEKKRDIEQSKTRQRRLKSASKPQVSEMPLEMVSSSSKRDTHSAFPTTLQFNSTPPLESTSPSFKINYSSLSHVRSPVHASAAPQAILGVPLDTETNEPLLAFAMYHLAFEPKHDRNDSYDAQGSPNLVLASDATSNDELIGYNKELTSSNSLQDFFRELGYQTTGSDDSKLPALHSSHSPTLPTSLSAMSLPELLEQAGTKLSPSLFDQFVSSVSNSVQTPQYGPSVIPILNQEGYVLYDYYVNTLSRKVSIAPSSQDESNSYQKVFLPLAHKDDGVLYAILAWSCFDLNGQWTQKGMQYIEKALKHLETHHAGSFGRHSAKNRYSLIYKLAALLIMCSAEVCRGDVKRWPLFLSWGSRILSANGGIFNFNNDKEERWLITDFAYHDLLASSLLERRPYFPTQEYAQFFKILKTLGEGGLNPLLGISKMLYPMIGEISTLALEGRRASSIMTEVLQSSELDEEQRSGAISPVNNILLNALGLDKRIDQAKPEPEDLVNLTEEELDNQLSIFETFQLTAKLFLRQAVLHCSPRHLESQLLTIELVKCLDILIDTPAQASLVFPMFIAGIHVTTKRDRDNMTARLDRYMRSYTVTSISRIKALMQRVWELNPNGEVAIDWLKVLEEFKWDINFC